MNMNNKPPSAPFSSMLTSTCNKCFTTDLAFPPPRNDNANVQVWKILVPNRLPVSPFAQATRLDVRLFAVAVITVVIFLFPIDLSFLFVFPFARERAA